MAFRWRSEFVPSYVWNTICYKFWTKFPKTISPVDKDQIVVDEDQIALDEEEIVVDLRPKCHEKS